MLLTIKASATHVPAGNYNATFAGIEATDNEHGKAYLWKFDTKDGLKISGISDADKPPSPGNKTGRWLAALSKKPLAPETQVLTSDYVGKSYLVIMTPNPKSPDKTRLETFSALW